MRRSVSVVARLVAGVVALGVLLGLASPAGGDAVPMDHRPPAAAPVGR